MTEQITVDGVPAAHGTHTQQADRPHAGAALDTHKSGSTGASPLLVLSRSVLDTLDYDPATVLDTVERAYLALGSGVSDNPRKLMSQPPEKHSVAYSMLGRDGARRTVGFKTSYKHDPDHDRNAQKYYTTLLLFDDATGLPIALMDGALVGALRTPAVSALIASSAPKAGQIRARSATPISG